MSVDQSLGGKVRVVEPPTPAAAEPGSWFLLLVPITICLGMLVFMALSQT